MEDAEIDAHNDPIDADEDAALDVLEAVATLVRVMKAEDLIRVKCDHFAVEIPGFVFHAFTTYAAAAHKAAEAIRCGAHHATIRYSDDGTFFSELWTGKAAS